MAKLKPIPMEFCYKLKLEEPYNEPAGGVALYGVNANGQEYFEGFETVDDMIEALEAVLESAKNFKEEHARP